MLIFTDKVELNVYITTLLQPLNSIAVPLREPQGQEDTPEKFEVEC